jgi:hypothetical protein
MSTQLAVHESASLQLQKKDSFYPLKDNLESDRLLQMNLIYFSFYFDVVPSKSARWRTTR